MLPFFILSPDHLSTSSASVGADDFEARTLHHLEVWPENLEETSLAETLLWKKIYITSFDYILLPSIHISRAPLDLKL